MAWPLASTFPSAPGRHEIHHHQAPPPVKQAAFGGDLVAELGRAELADAPLHRHRVDLRVDGEGEGHVHEREDERAVGQLVELQELLRHHSRDPGEVLRSLFHLHPEQREEPVARDQSADPVADGLLGHVYLPCPEARCGDFASRRASRASRRADRVPTKRPCSN